MERLQVSERYDNMRGWFAYELHGHMVENSNIWLVVGDLGYGMFDRIKADFPDRFLNAGAAEQAMMGVSVGLAEEGKIPFVYSITPFLLYRPFETIRNYVNHEKLPVKLVGSGRNFDYEHDGYSHWSHDAKGILTRFKHIKQYWPETKEEIPQCLDELINNGQPSFISLRR